MIHGFLNDYTFLIRGLLDLYECTYDSTWIEWAENLQDIQNQLFWDSSAKAFNLGCPEYHFSTILVKDGLYSQFINFRLTNHQNVYLLLFFR